MHNVTCKVSAKYIYAALLPYADCILYDVRWPRKFRAFVTKVSCVLFENFDLFGGGGGGTAAATDWGICPPPPRSAHSWRKLDSTDYSSTLDHRDPIMVDSPLSGLHFGRSTVDGT